MGRKKALFPCKRVCISMPPELAQEALHAARAAGMSLSALVTSCVQYKLKAAKEDRQ